MSKTIQNSKSRIQNSSAIASADHRSFFDPANSLRFSSSGLLTEPDELLTSIVKSSRES